MIKSTKICHCSIHCSLPQISNFSDWIIANFPLEQRAADEHVLVTPELVQPQPRDPNRTYHDQVEGVLQGPRQRDPKEPSTREHYQQLGGLQGRLHYDIESNSPLKN